MTPSGRLTVLRPARAYRVELAGITLLAYLYWWLTGEVGHRRQASITILTATALLMLVPPVRNGLATILHRSHLRRRWTLACRHADLATLNAGCPGSPGPASSPRRPAGAHARRRPVEDLEHAAETAAASLWALVHSLPPPRPPASQS